MEWKVSTEDPGEIRTWAESTGGRAREAKGRAWGRQEAWEQTGRGRGLKLMVPGCPGSTAVGQGGPKRTSRRPRAPHGRSDLGLEQGLQAAARKGTFLTDSCSSSVSITLTWWPALSYSTGKIKALWSQDAFRFTPASPQTLSTRVHQFLLFTSDLCIKGY